MTKVDIFGNKTIEDIRKEAEAKSKSELENYIEESGVVDFVSSTIHEAIAAGEPTATLSLYKFDKSMPLSVYIEIVESLKEQGLRLQVKKTKHSFIPKLVVYGW